MNYREFGTDNDDVVILLHGGGLSWWNYRDVAALLEDRFHVILPILDGHAASDRHFTSIEDNAAKIIDFIDKGFGGHVYLIGGLSLGAQILLEMLSQRADICSHALVESAAVVPSRLTHALIGPAFGSSYGLIRRRWFSRLQFKSLHMKEELFEDYYRDTCLIGKVDMIAFMKANTSYFLKNGLKESKADVHVFWGGRENREIKRSADLIRSALPACKFSCLKDLYHGEFSINHAGEYAEEIRSIHEVD